MTKVNTPQKILIANRGEVVVRLAQSFKQLGLKSVGIVCDDIVAHYPGVLDEHIQMDLNAYNSIFTDAKGLVNLAKKHGCCAIHPGWGFLSENHAFASLCEQQGLIFIGPKSQSIADFADKGKAKHLAEKAGLNVLNSVDESTFNNPIDFMKAVENLSFPIILKPALGGGGKGMSVVREKSELQEAMASSKRIALQAFANDMLLAEPYLEHARHIEVQVFSNGQQTYHFGSRDCTMQRRYQKVIEESFSTFLTEQQNLELCEQARQLVEQSGYESLGTVEFILDAQHKAYFMEMNTRLQVEHGITELVYDVDLVELQTRHALGMLNDVPAKTPRGHAIEVRLYAENTLKTFMPASGEILEFNFSKLIDRLDSDLCQGSTIGSNFDPMLAKILVWDVDRSSAIKKMQRVLAQSHVFGIEHNMNFVQWTLHHPDFKEGRHHIKWMEQHLQDFIADEHRRVNSLPLYAYYCAFKRRQQGLDQNLWYRVVLPTYLPKNILPQYPLENAFGELLELQTLANRDQPAHVLESHATVYMHLEGAHITFKVKHHDQKKHSVNENACFAPLNGVVKAIAVAEGQSIQAHQVLLSIEAMKMEYKILAPKDGTLQTLHVVEGQQVKEEQCLLELK